MTNYYVYLIGERNTSFYKIGVSYLPEKRMYQLQMGNPRLLVFKYKKKIGPSLNAYKVEAQILRIAKDMNAQANGEWIDGDKLTLEKTKDYIKTCFQVFESK